MAVANLRDHCYAADQVTRVREVGLQSAPAEDSRTGGAAIPAQHPLLHHLSRFFLRPVFKLYFGMRQEGFERLPRCGPYLLAPNHVSMLDWAFLSYFLPRLTRFVVHREYYDNALLGFGLRVNGALPIRTDRADVTAIRTALAVLGAGDPLILFPEGGISRTGRPGRFSPGVIAIAAAARSPIVPVAIRGAFEVFPRWRRFPRTGRVTVIFGEPLPAPDVSNRAGQQRLADRLMEHVTCLLDGVAPPPGAWS